MAIDLTVIFLTVNKVPIEWAKYHRDILLEAIGNYPLITVSKKPLDFGINIIQEEPESTANIYWQMLKAAKIVKTPYIAVAEDDVLYCREHFVSFRPPTDAFAYNMTRWAIFTWGQPMFSLNFWRSNMALIAPRELAIETLEERFNKYPLEKMVHGWELGKEERDTHFRLTQRKTVKFFTTTPIVYFQHDFGIDELERKHKKGRSKIRAFEIPHWGRAEDLVKKFV